MLKVIERSLKHILKLSILQNLILNFAHFFHYFVIRCVYFKLLIFSIKFYRHVIILPFERLKFIFYRNILLFLLLIKLMKQTQNFHYVLVLFFQVDLILNYTPNLKSSVTILTITLALKFCINGWIRTTITTVCQVLFVLKVDYVLLFHYFRHCFVYQARKSLIIFTFIRSHLVL